MEPDTKKTEERNKYENTILENTLKVILKKKISFCKISRIKINYTIKQ